MVVKLVCEVDLVYIGPSHFVQRISSLVVNSFDCFSSLPLMAEGKERCSVGLFIAGISTQEILFILKLY